MTSNSPSPAAAAMAASLDRLWAKFLPEIERRLETVESAARALAAGALADNERETAHQAAHKLAGILGTFGLPRGTELARQVEHQLGLALDSAEHAALAGSLMNSTSELRSILAHRN